MLPMMATGEIVEFDPWTGWTVRNTGRDLALGPMLSPSGTLHLQVEAAALSMTLNGRVMLRTDLQTTLSRIVMSDGRLACTIAPVAAAGYIDLPRLDIGDVLAVRLDGRGIGYVASAEGIRLTIAESAQDRRLDIYFSAADAR
jgi:putative isomerase